MSDELVYVSSLSNVRDKIIFTIFCPKYLKGTDHLRGISLAGRIIF
jgi:hypothetical protein